MCKSMQQFESLLCQFGKARDAYLRISKIQLSVWCNLLSGLMLHIALFAAWSYDCFLEAKTDFLRLKPLGIQLKARRLPCMRLPPVFYDCYLTTNLRIYHHTSKTSCLGPRQCAEISSVLTIE